MWDQSGCLLHPSKCVGSIWSDLLWALCRVNATRAQCATFLCPDGPDYITELARHDIMSHDVPVHTQVSRDSVADCPVHWSGDAFPTSRHSYHSGLARSIFVKWSRKLWRHLRTLLQIAFLRHHHCHLLAVSGVSVPIRFTSFLSCKRGSFRQRRSDHVDVIWSDLGFLCRVNGPIIRRAGFTRHIH
jgi:hypothetical protein